MFVKPAPGLAVRDPELRDLLPAEGREVARSEYWLRRVLDGDAVEAEAPAAEPNPPADPEATPALPAHARAGEKKEAR